MCIFWVGLETLPERVITGGGTALPGCQLCAGVLAGSLAGSLCWF